MPMGKPPPHYTEEEKQNTLRLAAAVGRRAAVQQLGISSATFQRWTERFPQLWSDLRAGDPEAQKQGFAQRLEDLAESYTAVEHQALERAETLIDKSDAKETAALIKAMGSSRQTATVGARAARGDDRDTVEHNINFPQLEAAMERLLNGGAPQPALQAVNEAEAVVDE